MRLPNIARIASAGALALAGFLTACNDDQASTESEYSAARGNNARIAVAELSGTQGNQVSGTVTFIEDGDQIRVIANINGLKAGDHGFHVHENGDCSAPDAKSAGGHFNPTDAPHAARAADHRHVGDLGNIEANKSGVAHTEFEDAMLSFDGETSIIGKAVIVHAGKDDLNSQPSGDAGARVACGVIQLQK